MSDDPEDDLDDLDDAEGVPSAGARRNPGAKAAAGDQPVRLDDFLLTVYRLSAHMKDATLFAKLGITVDEWAVLKSISDKPEVFIHEAGRLAGIPKTQIRSVVGALEKKGLVSIALSTGEQRVQVIKPSPRAAELVTAAAAEFDHLTEKTPSFERNPEKRYSMGVRIVSKLAKLMALTEKAAKPAGAGGGTGAAQAERARLMAERGGRPAGAGPMRREPKV